MDLYSASAWLHHQPTPLPDSSQQEGTQSSPDDWKDRSTATAGLGSSPSAQPSLDLSEFTLDIPGEQFVETQCGKHLFDCQNREADDISLTGPSTSTSSSSSQPFYGHPYQNNFFLPSSVPGPYNAMAYGTTWGTQSQLPLSNYSSLNGATTTSSPSSSSQQPQQQQQQQQHPSPQPMVIEYVAISQKRFCHLTFLSPQSCIDNDKWLNFQRNAATIYFFN